MIKYIDCETDLRHEQQWCWAVATDDEAVELDHDSEGNFPMLDGLEHHTLAAHNAIGFESHRLGDIGIPTTVDNYVDTLVLSRLYHPSYPGGHSLAAWGERLGFKKGDFPVEQFDFGYTPEMGKYCMQDVEVLRKLHKYLIAKLDKAKFSEYSRELEHKAAWVTDRMCRRGFPLDVPLVEKTLVEHSQAMMATTRELQDLYPPIIEERISEKTGKVLAPKVTEFNVGSRQQIGERLAAEGVKFTEFTPTGRPKIDETTLGEIDHPAAQKISEYLTMVKMNGMMESWLKHVDDDGRIRGRVNPCGAVTGRMTHSNPNMGQIPRKNLLYRRMFTASEGKVLVGCDASGLELRVLAHYMDDPEYTDLILTGDIHSYNQEKAGLQTRDQAKTFIYAFLYGAGADKIGQIVGGGKKEGAQLKADFLAGVPKLDQLIKKVHRIAEGGTVPGLDGRRVRVREVYASLNTLFQSAGAILMKQAMIQIPEITEYELLMHVHDEFQGEVDDDDDTIHRVGNALVDSIRTAGEFFQLRCPLDGEYKYGRTWADTH